MADVRIEPISRLLIANRGEIARRILRTAHDMGIDTVAVYADGDADAPFVREAGSAIALNGRTARQTYLDVGKMIDACRRAGADAVHPGYGFLSENEAFAQAVIDAGLKWLGPSPEVIGLMGDKLSAKALMQEAGVPTLNAVEIADAAEPAEAARQIGYPVLVKAAAGGGGRGMRVVADESGLEAAIAGARREAGAAFGDDTLFLEQWLDHARHVEMQILGDRHGNLVHCFERECSIQRRHQKVIEEAPSPAVTPRLRQRLGAAAIAAARKLGYSSAGTVEFLVRDDEFFFLEVNARLQVEHPVTEEIIGRDLVREQIRIAEGEPLSFTQDDLAINGWAIEARLYAENPERNFLPAPGTVAVWRPAAAGQARYDSGVESGSEISIEFDSMIAKVTAHGPTRREATGRLARALEATQIHGLTTNRDFLVATLRTPEFLAGDTTTDFIERVNPPRRRTVSRAERIEAAVAAALEGQARRRARARTNRGGAERLAQLHHALAEAGLRHRRRDAASRIPVPPRRQVPHERRRRRGNARRIPCLRHRARGGHHRRQAPEIRSAAPRRRLVCAKPRRRPDPDPTAALPRPRRGRPKRRLGRAHARRRAFHRGRRRRCGPARPTAAGSRSDEDGAPHRRATGWHGGGAARDGRGPSGERPIAGDPWQRLSKRPRRRRQSGRPLSRGRAFTVCAGLRNISDPDPRCGSRVSRSETPTRPPRGRAVIDCSHRMCMIFAHSRLEPTSGQSAIGDR